MIEAVGGLARASTMIDLGRFEEAAALLAQVVAADPDNHLAWGLFARAHLGAGRYAETVTAAGRAAVLMPHEDWPHRMLSKAYLHQAQPVAAMRAAEEACRLAPDQWRPYLCLAEAALGTEAAPRTGADLDVAAKAADAARRLAPEEPEVHFMSGVVSMARGDRKAARAHHERVLALDPAHSAALNELGRISLRWFGTARGAHHFLRATRLAPQISLFGYNVGVAVRRTVGLTVSLATVPSCVLTVVAALIHLPRIAVVAGLAVIAGLTATFGLVQYGRMPAELKPLFRRWRVVTGAAAGYGPVLAALTAAAVTPATALTGALQAATLLMLGGRVVAFWLLRQPTDLPNEDKVGSPVFSESARWYDRFQAAKDYQGITGRGLLIAVAGRGDRVSDPGERG